MSHIKITLGETDYELPARLNIGQLEKISEILEGKSKHAAFDVLGVALARAEPKVADVRDIDATVPEIAAAMNLILESGGFKATAAVAET